MQFLNNFCRSVCFAVTKWTERVGDENFFNHLIKQYMIENLYFHCQNMKLHHLKLSLREQNERCPLAHLLLYKLWPACIHRFCTQTKVLGLVFPIFFFRQPSFFRHSFFQELRMLSSLHQTQTKINVGMKWNRNQYSDLEQLWSCQCSCQSGQAKSFLSLSAFLLTRKKKSN